MPGSAPFALGQYRLTAPVLADGTYATLRLDSAQRLITSTEGGVASGDADSGNPTKIGGVYNTTSPTFADGERGDVQIDENGALRAALRGLASSGVDGVSNSLAWATRSPANTVGLVPQATFAYNGASWDRIRADVNGLVVSPGLSAGYWVYTSGTSPILSNTTTAVTLKAAAGAGVRNFIDSIQITTTAFGASVPLVIRNGASGTVIWAVDVPTAGFLDPVTITFPMPLRGSANTLLEIATPTANTTGTVTVSVQGHTGT